ncbi:Smr/MutS family protein [Sphingomonas sp.]|uniref:Smr/MutS family protein n=1 Tax=Sphingomonas sp. TaxID=28214 RepID=UPI00286E56BC|nr:Smr/MutS family protein [Sphingomonas sp.]
MRPLSPDESELWARVTATIRPLSRTPLKKAEQSQGVEVKSEPPVAATQPRKLKGPPPRIAAKPPSPPRPGTTLDGGWDRRLKAGSIEPDRILDLHGHDLDRAWFAIDRALEAAIACGDRVLLLITGHARAGEPPVERGRIRAAVHDWLAVSRHAGKIAAVRGAHRRHGGGGSLYIILRRR